MSCSNCFNGCAEIVSDKCVKYTGVNVPELGIETGDTLLSVENKLTSFIINLINATAITPTVSSGDICPIVGDYLPGSLPIDLNEYLTAIIKAICDVKDQADVSTDAIDTLNANYTISCLSGVTASSDTHDIVQAIITKLCSLNTTCSAIAIDLSTNYVKIADINSYIAAYLSSIEVATQQYLKMVPYTVVEYYGALTGYPTISDGFSGTGVGYGAWEKVYLCNGLNGTPDKRGRVPVGVTNGMGGGAFDAAVDPAISGNPTYSLGTKAGANTITLTSSQIPAHTHTATATATDTGHTHLIAGIGDSDNLLDGTHVMASAHDAGGNSSYELTNAVAASATVGKTGTNTSLGISVGVTVNASTGGGGSHANNQPALACYYIMYIP